MATRHCRRNSLNYTYSATLGAWPSDRRTGARMIYQLAVVIYFSKREQYFALLIATSGLKTHTLTTISKPAQAPGAHALELTITIIGTGMSTVANDVTDNPSDRFADSNEDDTIDLREYAKILRKHRWAILLSTAIITAISAYVVSGMTPIYRATSTLLIETQQTMPMNFDELVGIDTGNKEYYQTQFEVLKSRKLAKRVIEEMGLYTHPELHKPSDILVSQPATESAQQGDLNSASTSIEYNYLDDTLALEAEPIERQIAVNRFLKKLTIIPVKNTKLVRISFESSDAVLSARIANKIADTYIVSYLDSRMEMGEKATSWLGERLTDLKLKLAESQNKLLSYREENGLVDIGGSVGRLSEQEIGIVTSKLLDAEARMAQTKILFDDVSATKAKGSQALLGLPTIDSNEMVRRFKINEQEAQFNLDELSNRYGAKHPRVIDAVSRLQTAQGNLDSQIYNIVDTIEKDYLIAKQTAASLAATLAAGKQEIQQVGRSQVDLMHLEREVELNQKMYDTFYTRIREVDEAEDMSTTNAQISEYAEAPLTAVKPRKALVVLLTLLMSLAAAIAAAILSESMNDTITSTEDVEKTLKLRMLGIIPTVTKKTLKENAHTALVPGALSDGRDSFEESIRTIRTSICLEEIEDPNQIIMVTSALPGEGKSTLASHLAHSLSQVERVLLIECDLRRPSLHKAFDFKDSTGLAQLLSGEAKFVDAIKLQAIDKLDVIPAGQIPKNPLELLGSAKFSHLIEQMKKRYDRIVIDSAPVQAVSDALILGQFADAVLYAVKANSTPMNISARGVKRLSEAGINMAGAVVTQVNIKKISQYGGDLDYQGFYDYYGYAESETSSMVEATKPKSEPEPEQPSKRSTKKNNKKKSKATAA